MEPHVRRVLSQTQITHAWLPCWETTATGRQMERDPGPGSRSPFQQPMLGDWVFFLDVAPRLKSGESQWIWTLPEMVDSRSISWSSLYKISIRTTLMDKSMAKIQKYNFRLDAKAYFCISTTNKNKQK